MTLKKFFIYFSLLFIWSCSEKENLRTEFSYGTENKGVLQIHLPASNDSFQLSLYYNNLIPYYQLIKDFDVYNDTVINFDINTNFPTLVMLKFGDLYGKCVILNNDTLELHLKKGNITKSNSFQFKGTTASASKYLCANKNYSKSKPFLKQQNIEYYISFYDSIINNRNDSLYFYNKVHDLPKWFVKWESANIYFKNEAKKYRTIQDQIINGDSLYTLDYNILKETPNSFLKIRYLSTIRSEKYDTLLLPQNRSNKLYFEYTSENIKNLDGKVPDDLFSYFIAYKVTLLLMDRKIKRLEENDFKQYYAYANEILEKYESQIKDTILFSYTKQFISKQYEKYYKIPKLKSGDKAPDFYLKNLNGTAFKLNDFNGKITVLNFWGADCIPCLRSIPEKNKLFDKFSSNDVEFVNVCIQTPIDNMEYVLKENEFKGIHLHAKGNWNKLIKKRYGIFSVPHITLINQEGIIIQNKINQDSLEYFLQNNI